MIPILRAGQDDDRIAAIRGKLSLKPLLLQGMDEHDGAAKFETVRAILRDVQARGDAAILEYTEKFERTRLTAETMRVGAEEIAVAVRGADPKFLRALDLSIENVRRYQAAMLPPAPPPIPAFFPRTEPPFSPSKTPSEMASTPPSKMAPATPSKMPSGTPSAGGVLGVKYTPLERVGLYVPGGAAAYPSSVVMTAVPAQVAGVRELCICSPMRNGRVAPAVLAAASRIGISEIYAIGGAQAIAAMAFGTRTIRAVDKIVGPGNTYVQLAKKELYGIVDIDSFAGPSEVIVLADDTADPRQVAAELLAQAEHAPGSCLLITASEMLAGRVLAELEVQIKQLSREALTREALAYASALIVTRDHAEAIRLTDLFAPEHLQITTADSDGDAGRVQHAGAIFIGPHTPVAAGDYLAGPSHVLPTSGTARFFSGLSAESFRKRTSLIRFDAAALEAMGDAIVDFATIEGFDAHARSVTARK